MFIILLFLWFVFNGRFTVEILLIGIAVSAVVCLFMSRFAGYSFTKELRRLKLIPAFLVYLLVLLREIFVANITVLRMIFKGSEKLTPAVCHFKTTLRSPLARTILANSITLTPGTITVSLHGDELYVHCLDKSLAEGMSSSVFVKRLEKMESRDE